MADLSPRPESPVAERHRLSRRAQIASLQRFMEEEVPKDQHVECEVRHYFSGPIYIREMHAPKGALIVGKLHKTPHLTTLVKGKITITTEEGSQTIEAPLTLEAKPGMKRVGYCHEDTIWQSIHHVGDERDLEAIEAKLIAPDFADLAAPEDGALLEGEATCLS